MAKPAWFDHNDAVAWLILGYLCSHPDAKDTVDGVEKWWLNDMDISMIGRGAFGNPWLFRDAQALLAGRSRPPAPDAAERFRVALQHARLGIRLQGDSRKTVIEFRKHFGWYTKGLHGASDLRARLFQVETMAEAEEIFASYLGPIAQVA